MTEYYGRFYKMNNSKIIKEVKKKKKNNINNAVTEHYGKKIGKFEKKV